MFSSQKKAAINQFTAMGGGNIESEKIREITPKDGKTVKKSSIGIWTREDTIKKYAYLNVLGHPKILRLRKTDKEFAEDFNYYYSLLDEIAENMLEFSVYWEMMLKLLEKYDII